MKKEKLTDNDQSDKCYKHTKVRVGYTRPVGHQVEAYEELFILGDYKDSITIYITYFAWRLI